MAKSTKVQLLDPARSPFGYKIPTEQLSHSYDEIKADPKFADDFLCPMKPNIYGLEFIKLSLRDFTNNKIIIDLSKPQNVQSTTESISLIRYTLPSNILRLKAVGALIEFKFGAQENCHLKMLERHFYDLDKPLKTFEFDFGLIIPKSCNTYEHIYEVPEFKDEHINEIVDQPWAVRSDTFYFVNNQLIMHNKAEYHYFEEFISK